MATAAPENHQQIRELQQSLKQALAGWDTADKPTAFARIVPAANALVAAQNEQLRKRAEHRTAGLRRAGGWGLLAVAVVAFVLLVLSSWNLWWLAALVPALTVGLFLLVAGGNRG